MLFTARRITSVLPVLALLVASCGGEDSPDKPSIKSFTATPAMVVRGQSLTLAWTVENAVDIKITAGAQTYYSGRELTGSMSATVDADTTFTLTATKNGVSDTKTTSVRVTESQVPPPKIDSFDASATMVPPNGSVTLTWSTTDAESVDISDGAANLVSAGAADGTFDVTPAATTTYTLTAKNSIGATVEASVMVLVTTVVIPEITSFTVNPTAVIDGDPATLSWTVTGAVNVKIVDDANNSVYDGTTLTGTQMVTPSVASFPGVATYRLTATGADNTTATASVMVGVDSEPVPQIVSFTATPATIDPSESAELAWMVTGAVSIEISAGGNAVHTSSQLAGTFSVSPLATTTYTLAARNARGTAATATIDVTVTPTAPPILAFTATPNPMAIGGATVLAWNTVTADSITIRLGGMTIHTSMNNQGTFSVNQSVAAADYTLEVANAVGMNSQTITVNAHAAPVINQFSVTPVSFAAGAAVTATITYDVSSAATINILANGVTVPGFVPVDVNPSTTDRSGTVSMHIAATTQFTIVAQSAAGMATQIADVTELLDKIEPNDTPLTATLMTPGSVTTGSINPSGDVDWYAVVVPRGGWLSAGTTNLQGVCDTTTDSEIAVYSSTAADDAHLLAINDDVGFLQYCSLVTPFGGSTGLQDLAGGTYYIRVRPSPFDLSQIFDYLLDVQIGSASCGNGLAETLNSEQCDDANATNLDGCDQNCLFEINATAISPPGGTAVVDLAASGGYQLVRVDITTGGQSIVATAADAAGGCDVIDTGVILTDAAFHAIGVQSGNGPSGTAGECGAFLYPETTATRDLAAGTYYIFVLNEGSGSGQATLTVSIVDPACGNGVTTLNSGEECDDGNLSGGDACDATCQVSVAQIPGAGPVTYPGSISVVTEHDFIPITVTAESYLIAGIYVPNQTTACSDDPGIALTDASSVRRSESTTGRGLSCAQIGPDVSTRVQPGDYLIEVWDDGDDGVISAYEVVIDSRPADVCGNSVSEAAEACDDGNTAAGDGCSATCQLEAAVLPAPNALTYPGAITTVAEHDIFPFTATAEMYVRAEIFAPAAGTCNADTVIQLLDNAMTVIGEDDDDGLASCSMFGPLDGFTRIQPGSYSILVQDFGDNDLISAYVLVLEGYPVDVCGNSAVEAGETCDDGNTAAGDGCGSTCQVESTCDLAQSAMLGTQNGDTTLGFDSNQTLCDGFNQPGREQVWRYTATFTGDLQIDMTATEDMSVYVRSPSCTDDLDTLDCEDIGFSGDTETLVVPVTSGASYNIIVDSYSSSNFGPYTLTLTQL